jgi:hypothetical protein
MIVDTPSRRDKRGDWARQLRDNPDCDCVFYVFRVDRILDGSDVDEREIPSEVEEIADYLQQRLLGVGSHDNEPKRPRVLLVGTHADRVRLAELPQGATVDHIVAENPSIHRARMHLGGLNHAPLVVGSLIGDDTAEELAAAVIKEVTGR